ncbi:M20 metallopeptidase family protein [Salicibibacter kimchii]|uniref:Amidohydrolase n=1 Tax=Salicibibacter kimchii TaxID=2099786 RepID=A0A345BZN5_9BACI|nr:M20 family metallopeptidase [Salicibibacter kimchii]AXF56416.1 amidohydrolase [Salicibibacter kimchii]
MVIQEAEQLLPWLSEVRRDFHMYPELGMDEHRTMDRVCHYLDALNIPYKKNIANTGVVGVIEGNNPDGKTIALRADMDALPIHEKNDVPYRSRHDGKMHACGHDAHMTILLGAAYILTSTRDRLPGNVKLLFQPAEETVGGAAPMIEEGALEHPQVEAVLGLHVAPELPVGNVGVRYGQMNASSDALSLTVNGKGAHAAYPAGGKDAIIIASQVISALQTVVSRNVDARESAVVTFGTVSGGTQPNIIADRVRLQGTMRTLDPKVRAVVLDRIQETVRNVAKGLGGSAELAIEPGYTALINDDEMVDLVKGVGVELLGKDRVTTIPKPSLGVEDFSFFAEEVPGAFYRLGVRNEAKGIVHGGHTSRFDIDEQALAIGAAMQAGNVWGYLNNSRS